MDVFHALLSTSQQSVCVCVCLSVCVCVCERVCAYMCSQEPLVYHLNVLVMTAVLCVVRSCSTPGVWCGSVLTHT